MSYRIYWETYSEINKLKRNKTISDFGNELDKSLKNENSINLSLLALDFLREILITAGDNYQKKDELNEELYWFRYSFLEGDDENTLIISEEIFSIFFNFYSNPDYNKIIREIDFTKKKILEISY